MKRIKLFLTDLAIYKSTQCSPRNRWLLSFSEGGEPSA